MKQGFSLLEVMISSAIFIIVCGMAMSFSVSAVRQTEITTTDAAAQVGMVRITERIQAELAQSAVDYDGKLTGYPTPDIDVVDQIQPFVELTTTGSNYITFRMVETYTGAPDFDTVWSDWITYKLIPGSKEIMGNGIDDNGNGVADEMWLQRIKPPELDQVITRDINFISTPLNPNGIRFLLSGKLMTIEISYSTSTGERPRNFHIAVALDSQ